MSDLWLVEYDRIFQDLDDGKIGYAKAASQLKLLGVEETKIEEEIALYHAKRPRGPRQR